MNFQSILTPGGIAQASAGLGQTLLNAPIQHQQDEMELRRKMMLDQRMKEMSDRDYAYKVAHDEQAHQDHFAGLAQQNQQFDLGRQDNLEQRATQNQNADEDRAFKQSEAERGHQERFETRAQGAQQFDRNMDFQNQSLSARMMNDIPDTKPTIVDETIPAKYKDEAPSVHKRELRVPLTPQEKDAEYTRRHSKMGTGGLLPSSMPQDAPATPKIMPRAILMQKAQKAGLTPEAAAAHYQSLGFTIGE